MKPALCLGARSLQRLESIAESRARRQSSIGPNDLLVNVSWPLILILSIAAINAAGQARAIMDIEAVVERWDESGKSQILIEVFRQQLLRKIDAVCEGQRQKLNVHLLPEFSRVATKSGLPDDGGFAEMCREASRDLVDVESLTKDLYGKALIHVEDGLEPMFDPIVFPGTAPMVKSPNILGESSQSKAYRQFAIDRIRERVTDWQFHVVSLQQQAVDHLLDSPAIERLRDAERSRTAQHIRAEFDSRGYPLLPGAL